MRVFGRVEFAISIGLHDLERKVVPFNGAPIGQVDRCLTVVVVVRDAQRTVGRRVEVERFRLTPSRGHVDRVRCFSVKRAAPQGDAVLGLAREIAAVDQPLGARAAQQDAGELANVAVGIGVPYAFANSQPPFGTRAEVFIVALALAGDPGVERAGQALPGERSDFFEAFVARRAGIVHRTLVRSQQFRQARRR